jgi:hypothetical protein
MEEYLYDWCLHEYLQMKDYLESTSCRLIITNAKPIFSYSGNHEEENKRNLNKLIAEFEKAGEGKCKLVEDSVT